MRSTINGAGRRLDLNLLVVFEAIYRSRNLTAAGRALNLSQPAVSHALARMREVFKDPLFVRLPRGLQPTPLANDLAPVLMEGLGTIRSGLERRSFDPAMSTRVFTIGMGDIAEAVQLPRLLLTVRQIAPHVTLRTTQIPGPRLRDALGDGEIDVATGDYALGAGCRETLLYESTYACVLRADHPNIGKRISAAQFAAAEHILVAPQAASRHEQNIKRALTHRKVNARIGVQITHFNAVPALVTSTDMIATIPTLLAESMRSYENIRILPPPIPLPKVTVSLYWHERFHREPGNAWLRQVYTDVIGR